MDENAAARRSIRRCFLATLTAGAALLGLGLLVVPVLPHFQLDVALTPEQLRDKAVVEQTTELLERASGNQWAIWSLAGLLVIAVSLRGL
jgi:hypothetical protein